MAVAPASQKLAEASKVAKENPAQAEQTYKDILKAGPGSTDAATRDFETALIGLGSLLSEQKRAQDLAELVSTTRSELSSLPKAKTAKLVRQLLDLFQPIPDTSDLQIQCTKDCIEWATSTRRGFLRQSLETRLVSLYLTKQSYYAALTLINSLLKELKRLDDKLVLVEVQLLESRAYHSLGNGPKGRAALTSARTSAASVYTPPMLQAGLDMQSGKLHAEDGDFTTAFSYFIEAMEGYHGQDDAENATAALQYMLLCKVMLNEGADMQQIMTSKHATKYAGPKLDAIKAIAGAHQHRSLAEYEDALGAYRDQLGADSFVRGHLRKLYDAMLEQNLLKVIEPFSKVEISHVAKMVGLDTLAVERKLSQMILDKQIAGVLDQGEGCLLVYDEGPRDGGYDAALATVEKLGGVVEALWRAQAAALE